MHSSYFTSRPFLTPLLLLAPIVSAAQEAVEEAEAEDLIYFTAADLPWLIGMILLFLGILGFIGYRLHQGVSEQFQAADSEEWQFEQALISETKTLKTAGKTPEKTDSVSDSPAAPEIPASAPVPVAIPPPEPSTVPDTAPEQMISAEPVNTVSELAARLQESGILGKRQGMISMPIPPDALIYSLKKGGTAVLLPRVESEAFLAHQVKRFDAVFALTHEGEVIYLSLLQKQNF